MKNNFFKRLHSFLVIVFSYIYIGIRACIGPKYTCIYIVSCSDYASCMLRNHKIYIALPTIAVRLISCNPIVGIIKRYYILRKKNL